MAQSARPFESVRARFVTTDWGAVEQAALVQSLEIRQQALARLYRDYWPPIYAFVRRRGYNRADAEDLTQDFFQYLLGQSAYAKADHSKGRFRSFLLGWLKKFLQAAHARDKRIKRGGEETFVFLDADVAALDQLGDPGLLVASPRDEERYFEWLWATRLIERAMQTLEAENSSRGKARIFRQLKPFLQGGTNLPSQTEVAAQLRIPAETLRSHLTRLRARYRSLLLKEVSRTVLETSDAEEELLFLYRILTTATFTPPLDP